MSVLGHHGLAPNGEVMLNGKVFESFADIAGVKKRGEIVSSAPRFAISSVVRQ